MLACTHPSGRPRPPAQVRRSPSMNSFMEDEEQLMDDQMVASTPSRSRRAARLRMSTGARPMTVPDEQLPSPTELRPAVNDVLNGRTREELQEMLLAAHTIIRQHEQGEFGLPQPEMRRSPGSSAYVLGTPDADLTSASNETTYLREQNLVLKDQFDKLSTRLPQSPKMGSLDRSRSQSVLSSLFSDEGPESRPMSPLGGFIQTPLRSHKSRMSMTSPVALAQLADQNAELVSRLDDLQAETSKLDHAGKRKLKKLEHEIDTLKDELDRVQRRNQELEHEAEEKEQASKHDEEELEKKRLEREEKTRALRRSTKTRDDTSFEVQDFAPNSSISSFASFNSPSRVRVRTSSGVRAIPLDLDLSSIIEPPPLGESPPGSAIGTLRETITAGETAIVVQLLEKIEELENANREFIRQRAETEAKIQFATEQVNSMRQAYQDAEDEVRQAELYGEFAEEEEERDWVDEQPLPEPVSTSSLRLSRSDLGSVRSMRSDVVTSTIRQEHAPVKILKSRSSKGSLKPLRPSPRGIGNQRMMAAKKVRKPLTQGMFLSPPTSPPNYGTPLSEGRSNGFLQPPDHRALSSRRGRDRFAAVDFGRTSPGPERDALSDISVFEPSLYSALPDRASLRQAPSFGELGRYMGALGIGSPGPAKRSLENELMGEYGPDWSLSQDDINRQMFDVEVASRDGSFSSLFEEEEEGDPESSHPAVSALQSALDPANRGRLLEEGEHILPLGCLRDSPADTFYGLEQAIAARPQRWSDAHSAPPPRLIASGEDGTYPIPTSPVEAQEPGERGPRASFDPWESTVYASDQEEEQFHDALDDPKSALILAPKGGRGRERQETTWDRLDQVLISSKRDSALIRLNADLLKRRRHSFADSDASFDAVEAPAKEKEAEEHVNSTRYDPKALAAKLRNTGLETFLEVWLILQFVLVLVVFVYSSVRQGPRAVMLGQQGGGRRRK
ncbi:hypothetical protein FRC01_007808 [Tulasnella sp. 417]|nr:hypothetical protein FRC01_007808 [Tulasnella sp. 417]